ncbi:MAG: M20/M25/M40 family metallo-hydrolase [Candidatus Aminicenantes bacterium]|nr:MAG: M20/M25/M40 family metallo-hydrolase [Candidatus Aminicenantes bacterium]
MIRKWGLCRLLFSGLLFGMWISFVWANESLFNRKIAESEFVQELFSFVKQNEEAIIAEWRRLTEIPAPSGYEEKRAQYMKSQFETLGLDEISIDQAGNVIGIWRGTDGGKKIVLSAHMDTVFQGVNKIHVKREGNVLIAPGIGDDTASLINLIWSLRAFKKVGFKPKNTYYFLATVGEETGFDGMRVFMDSVDQDFTHIIALDGDLGKVHYGALGFGGGKITFRGPGAHTMQSRGVPNPNLAVAKAIDRICQIDLPSMPIEKWTILNVGMIMGGKVRNAVSQESSFTIDLRSGDQEEIGEAQKKIREICGDVASETGVMLEIQFDDRSKAFQIPGARDSALVQTVVDVLEYLEVIDIEVDPLGSTEANVGIERGILSVNLGRTYGRYKHSLREEADIDGLFLAMKQIMLLICCLE